MNPFNALATFVLGKMKQSAMSLWLKLLFTMVFSALCSFLFTCGTVLVSTKSWTLAVGSGMIVAATAMVVLYRVSPLTKGLTVVIPAAEAAKELETDFQTITKK
jgi:Na+/phosphate symporter